MALPARPPGPAFNRRPGGNTIGSLTFRMAAGATVVSFIIIAFQAGRIRARAPESGAEGSSEVASVTETASVTGTALVAATPVDPRLVPFHGLLEGVTDYEDIAQNRAYAALAQHVHSLTDEEAARILRKDLDFNALVHAPQLARGEMLRVDGMLIKLEAVRLAPGAGPPGVENAWRGWLMEPGGNECFVFDLIGDAPDVSTRDLVRVEGTFLKVLRYDLEHPQMVVDAKGEPVRDAGGRLMKVTTRDAPFLIARRAWRPAEGEIERPFRYDYLAVVILTVVGVVLLIQRKRAGLEAALLEAKHAEIARRLNRKKPMGDA